MYIHMLNRLINLIRDEQERIYPPCENCHEGRLCLGDTPCEAYSKWKKRNNAKKSLTAPKNLGDSKLALSDADKERLTYKEDHGKTIDIKTYAAIIEKNLKPSERKLWLMYLDGNKLRKADHELLMNVIGDIVESIGGV